MAQDNFRQLLLQLRAEHERQLDDLHTRNKQLMQILRNDVQEPGFDIPFGRSEIWRKKGAMQSQRQFVGGAVDVTTKLRATSLDDRVVATKTKYQKGDPLRLNALEDPSAALPCIVHEESIPQNSTTFGRGSLLSGTSSLGSPASRRSGDSHTGKLEGKAYLSSQPPLRKVPLVPLIRPHGGQLACTENEIAASQSAFLLSSWYRGSQTFSGLLMCCFRGWQRHVERLCRPCRFEVLNTLVRDHSSVNTQIAKGKDHTQVISAQQSEMIVRADGRCSQILISPGGPVRTSWDLLCTMLLAYDIIMVIVSTSGLRRQGFLVAMEWFTLIFWTVDMFMSCITGVLDEGVVVLSAVRILHAYLRTWFWLDVIVVIPNWIFTIIGSVCGYEGGTSGKCQKLMRTVRIVRMMLLLRLVKLQRILTLLRDQIDSDVMFVVINVMKMISMLFILNHFIAALWLSIGSVGREGGGPNWIDSVGIQDETIEYRYLTSLHWSICLITRGAMAVRPQNSAERAFAILALTLGMLVFTAFIGNITAAITQLTSMRGNNVKELWMLRRFLRHHNIHKELRFRVLRYVESNLKAQEASKSSIDKVWSTISTLSDRLRSEIQYEVSFSVLRVHPFLGYVSLLSRGTMIKLVGRALTRVFGGLNDVLFSTGGRGTHMSFLAEGEIHYAKAGFGYIAEDEEAKLAEKGDWFCETVLWTEWRHLGTARALRESDLIAIHAEQFVKAILMDASISEDVLTYAVVFVNRLSNVPCGRLSDLSQARSSTHTVHDMICEAIDALERSCVPALDARRPHRSRRRISFEKLSGDVSKSRLP